MIPYIGDISKADAKILHTEAYLADNILEFGCGASTQVMASAHIHEGEFISIDTDQGWIEKTKQNLSLFELDGKVTFWQYNKFMQQLREGQLFDFIFVDGVDGIRRQFAMDIWPYLKVGGAMGFHDTRRPHDFRNVLEVMAQFQNEILDVAVNCAHSNITLINKKKPEPYDNWQISENRQPWQLGYGDVPPEEVDNIKSQILKLKS